MIDLIVEVATNHGGSLQLAKEFIHEFGLAGATTIKFQYQRVKHLRKDDPQYNWQLKSQFTHDAYAELREECEDVGLNFLLTAYHPDEVLMIRDLGCRRIKVGSGEAGEEPMAFVIRESRMHPIVSCGLVTPEKTYFGKNATFLACVTRYPAPSGLAAALMLTGKYDGFSDHSLGLDELKAAVVCGATTLETHVQLPNQAREPKPFEKTIDEIRELRVFLNEDPAENYLGRWRHA